MTIQRMSDQHSIKFLETEITKIDTEVKEKKASKTLQQLAEEQKSRKLNNKDNGFMTSRHISSACTGDISDMGGPSKFTKSESSNTIWENDKVAHSSEIDSKTKTYTEKQQIATNKREAEQKRMDNMVNVLRDTDQTKASTVAPLNTYGGSNYKAFTNNFSMFDTEDFQRLQQKTLGEVSSEESSKRRAQEDLSWKRGGKSFSSKDVSKRFFDSLLNEE